MLQRIKTALTGATFWLYILLLTVLAVVWKKEKLAEDALEEEKASNKVKDDEKEDEQADHASAVAISNYESLRDAYLSAGNPSSKPGDSNTTNPNPGPKQNGK